VGLTHLVAGPDDALWFATIGTVGPMAVGRVTTSGEISYPFQRYCSLGPPLQCVEPRDLSTLAPGPRWRRGFGGIATGPDGAIWFTELEPNQIGRIGIDGVVAEYPIPTPASDPGGIVAGSDGALWFVEFTANQIGRITTEGEISEYRIPTADTGPLGITAEPGGGIWVTEGEDRQVGRITTAGEFTEYPLPTTIPYGVVVGPDEAIWFVQGVSRFSQLNATGIARISSEGTITEYPLPSVE